MSFEYLIENAFDLHVHSGPDVLPRKMNDLELAARFTVRGMAGFCLKSHYFCTAERAHEVRAVHPCCNTVGALVLNSAVGGLNPAAVEMAAMAGAKVVWFPTCDSAYEQAHIFGEHANPAQKLPFWAHIVTGLRESGIHCPTISLLEDGRLCDAVYDILDIAARRNLTLATGHISPAETVALAAACRERGVERFVITHANFPSTFFDAEQQRELAAGGAYIEHCYTTYATGKVDFELMAAQIRAVGSERVLISTDLGQPAGVYPDEGLLAFSQRLLESGFSEAEVLRMNGDNPRMLAS